MAGEAKETIPWGHLRPPPGLRPGLALGGCVAWLGIVPPDNQRSPKSNSIIPNVGKACPARDIIEDVTLSDAVD